MKKWLLLGLAVMGLASIAATCRLINISLTEIDGEAVFAGEFTNETGASFTAYRVNVAFVEDGDVQDSSVVEGCPRAYVNAQSIFFSAASDEVDPDDAAGLANIAVNSTLKVGNPAASGLEFDGNIDVFRSGDSLDISGNVLNDGTVDVEDVRVCVVVWDEDDNVVVVALDGAQDLDEDADYDFDVSVNVPDDSDVDLDHVDVYVDGLIDDKAIRAVVEDDLNIVVGTPTPGATNTPTSTPTATPTP